MHRLNPWRTGGALTITAAVLYGVCTFAVAVSPAGTLAFVKLAVHGLDLEPLLPAAGLQFSWGGFFCGLAGLAIASFATGALFVWIYNVLGGHRRTPG